MMGSEIQGEKWEMRLTKRKPTNVWGFTHRWGSGGKEERGKRKEKEEGNEGIRGERVPTSDGIRPGEERATPERMRRD